MNHAYLLWWNSLKSIRFKDYYSQLPQNYALWYSENYELDNIFSRQSKSKRKRRRKQKRSTICSHLSACYCHFITTIGRLASFCDATQRLSEFLSISINSTVLLRISFINFESLKILFENAKQKKMIDEFHGMGEFTKRASLLVCVRMLVRMCVKRFNGIKCLVRKFMSFWFREISLPASHTSFVASCYVWVSEWASECVCNILLGSKWAIIHNIRTHPTYVRTHAHTQMSISLFLSLSFARILLFFPWFFRSTFDAFSTNIYRFVCLFIFDTFLVFLPTDTKK